MDYRGEGTLNTTMIFNPALLVVSTGEGGSCSISFMSCARGHGKFSLEKYLAIFSFLSYLNLEMAQVVETLPYRRTKWFGLRTQCPSI